MDEIKEYRKLSDLKLNDKNPRGIKVEDFARLKNQIKALGQYKPVVIDMNNKVLGGNMRVRAYRELGIKDIWVSVVDPKSEEEEIAYILSDNDNVGYWEEQALAEVFIGMPNMDFSNYKVDIGESVSIPDLMKKFMPSEDEEENKGKLDRITQVTCPNCGHEFKP